LRPLLASLLFAAFAEPAAAQLHEIETRDLRLLFYDPHYTYLAPQLMRAFDNALEFHKRTFRYQPDGKVTVLLEDFGDYGHGGADVIPQNHVDAGIAPFNYIYETAPSNERMSWLMSHELTHVVEMDGTRGSDRFFRRLFGAGLTSSKVTPAAEDPVSMLFGYLTVPRRYAPRWYHEGLAVFMETWMSGGLGRSLGGYDEMVFRTMVRDNSHIYDVVGLEAEGTTIDFQVGVNSYLYGTRFMSYLAIQYGPEKVIEWAGSGEGSKGYFTAQFRTVFGKALDTEWSHWIETERTWQAQNLAEIRKYPVTPLKRLSGLALGSVSNAFYDETSHKILAAVRYPGPMAHLAAIDPESGRETPLHTIEGAALFYVSSLAFDAQARKLFFTSSNNDWRDLNVYDLATGKATKLIENFRGGDLAFDRASGSLWGVRHVNGLSILAETLLPYKEATDRFTFPYGIDVFDLDISPDGKRMSAVTGDSSGRQKLVTFHLDKLRVGDATMETIHEFEFSSGAAFTFSPDGAKLYGTSYFTGASNIFRFDVATHAMEVLSNTETGLFWPRLLPDGRLLAFEYTAKGFYPVLVQDPKPLEDVSAVKYFGQQVVEKYPQVRAWKLPPPADIDVAAFTTRAGEFKPLRNLRPTSVYPIVQGYKDSVAYGGRIDFSDGLGLAGVSLTAGYSPDAALKANERAHVGLTFHDWGWKVSAAYNKTDFYDLFGPTKESLKGFAGELGYKKTLRYKAPRTLDLDWSVAGYVGLDRLPDYQNVVAPFDKFLTGRISLTYSRLEKSLGAVDDEKGIRWKVATQGNAVNGDFYPRLYGLIDYGFLTPLRNSPVWIRSSVGKSFGDRVQPFANFYFGGFGNNWIDHQEVSRYREYYSFPGVDLDQIGATDFAKTTVEWNLPPKHFRHFGTTYLYCNWARLTLFSGVIVGNMASSVDRRFFGDAGMQVDFKVVISSYLNTTFSVGGAAAQDRNGRRSEELMISLKLL